MSIVKLASRESRARNRASIRDMRDNHFDSRPFLSRNAGKLIGAALGAGLTIASHGEASVALPVGFLLGSVSDGRRKIGQFRSGDERFKKIVR